MPRGDRTGPMGEGSMTGRRLGYCAGYDRPGFTGGGGRGLGLGLGYRGRGRGFFWFRRGATLPEEAPQTDEISALRSDVQNLKNSLSSILERLKSLSPDSNNK